MHRDKFVIAAVLSVALHALGVYMAVQYALHRNSKLEAAPPAEQVIRLEMVQIPPPRPPAVTPPERPDQTLAQAPAPKLPPARAAALQAPRETVAAPPPGERPLTSMNAPPAPTAQEWAAAGQYTLKNSKRYRYTWGQQVRSMMGTAIEGPDQGAVRFRIEIAPTGKLARLDTLWTTSATVEKRARKPLKDAAAASHPHRQAPVFENNSVFNAFDADAPHLQIRLSARSASLRQPVCVERQIAPGACRAAVAGKADPQAVADCLKQLPQDTIEAESAHNQRQLEQWGSSKLGR
ncbi:MAG: energy transducer TonB [Rhodoferax sp.]|nr:energy transducer TonB [Rhodoferax sp.]